MAEVKSILSIAGSLEGLTIYELNGKTVVRRKGKVSREKLMTSSNFARRRETMSEFGGASQMAKDMRHAWSVARNRFFGSYISGRLSGLLKSQIAAKGPGKRGQRSLSLLNYPQALLGFPFDRNLPFDEFMKMPARLSTDPGRTEVSLMLDNFKPADFLKAPPGASHFRIYLLATTVSTYSYDPDHGCYHPLNPSQNGLNVLEASTEVDLEQAQSFNLSLTAKLPVSGNLAPEVALLASLGIEFLQEVNGQYYELEKHRAMKVAGIW